MVPTRDRNNHRGFLVIGRDDSILGHRDARTTVTELRSQYPDGLIGVPGQGLRLSWSVESDVATEQLACQLSSSDDGVNWRDDPVITSRADTAIEAPHGDIPAGEVRLYRVRVATSAGRSGWSRPLTVEADTGGFSRARVITTPFDVPLASTVPYFRRDIVLRDTPAKARLRVSSLGVHEFRIGGILVATDHLNPGWTSYAERTLTATHDVTALLQSGRNTLAAAVGDGWFRGRLGWTGSAVYGHQLGLIAELTIDYADGDREVFATDETWQVTRSGVRRNSLYDGYEIDLREEPRGWMQPSFADDQWPPARVLDFPLDRFVPRIADPVRTVAELPGSLSVRGDAVRVELQQNISGWLRIRVHGEEGERIEIRHAEVVDQAGDLHVTTLRSARSVDAYILDRTGEHVLEPRFTYHGFQFADVLGGRVLDAVGVAISSATSPRSTFSSGRSDLDRLHENVRWSQLDNFTSLPTDCPQRDERLGWTGDAQAFAATACTLFDSGAFWRSWMRDVAADQDADGSIPSIVPNHLLLAGDARDTWMFGRAGWADAATIVPWSVYQSTGDDEILREQLPTARAWVQHLIDRAAETGTGFLPDEFQYGDWLDPDAPGDQPQLAKTSSEYIAHAFWSWSARLLARMERVAGDAVRAARAEQLADEVAQLTWARWRDHAIGTQTGCALAIEFLIAPDAERAEVGERLADLVRANAGRISTGFLGTPHVLPALTSTGHDAEAYLMLLRTDLPSWLYEVHRGATTVWERWDAITEDGSIHGGDMKEQGDVMLSFNHYAYGAVIDWVYRSVAGIAPSPDGPGYSTIVIAPRPSRSLGHARATINTSRGEASVEWNVIGDDLELTTVVPFNASARLDLPLAPGSRVERDEMPFDGRSLPSGKHRIMIRDAALLP